METRTIDVFVSLDRNSASEGHSFGRLYVDELYRVRLLEITRDYKTYVEITRIY